MILQYPETANYTYHGKLLTHMTVDYTDFDEVAHQDKPHSFYGAQSRPAKVEFNGTVYACLHNLHSGIVGIVDNEGALVVEYKYDAWGKPISTWTLTAEYQALAVCNPFRYRGYAYDGETGLYSLRSRYYNPARARFLNADEFINVQKDVLSHNLFAYCINAPIVLCDENGHFWKLIQSVINCAVKVARIAVPTIGAEIQLILNRAKAKKVLSDISNKQTGYLTNHPYGGASNAFYEGLVGKYLWFYNQVNHNGPMDYKRNGQRP